MIGDWVIVESKPTKVDNVDADSINTTYSYEEVEDYIEEEKLSPIPLTAEILEKNGFIEGEIERNEFSDVGMRYTYETQDGCYVIIDWQDSFDNGCGGELHQGWEERWIIEVFGSNGSFNTNPLKRIYVHELQHALRLCGLTELADNFKVE